MTSFERTVRDLVELREGPDLVDKFMQDASRSAEHQFDPVVSQVPSGVADAVAPASRLDVKGLPTFDYRVYPVVNAMADKVCATMQSYISLSRGFECSCHARFEQRQVPR